MQLISDNYKKMQIRMHKRPRGFGGSGFRWAKVVVAIVKRFESHSMLDYGCGESTLWKEMQKIEHLDLDYHEYDPCIPGKDVVPGAALAFDLVTCTDVLEHVEPNLLINVLEHIHLITYEAVFFNIAQHAAIKILPDGRNAHLTVQPKGWWLIKLQEIFTPDYWFYEEIPVPVGREKKDFNLLISRKP